MRGGFGRMGLKRKNRFINGNMARDDNFVGVKIKTTIAKMIGCMSQKDCRCGTGVLIYDWYRYVGNKDIQKHEEHYNQV
jgi:hypothetical protein